MRAAKVTRTRARGDANRCPLLVLVGVVVAVLEAEVVALEEVLVVAELVVVTELELEEAELEVEELPEVEELDEVELAVVLLATVDDALAEPTNFHWML